MRDPVYSVTATNDNGDFVSLYVEVPDDKTVQEVVEPMLPKGNWRYTTLAKAVVSDRGIGEILL